MHKMHMSNMIHVLSDGTDPEMKLWVSGVRAAEGWMQVRADTGVGEGHRCAAGTG